MAFGGWSPGVLPDPIQLTFSEQERMFSIPVKVNGVSLKAFVNLSEPVTLADPEIIDGLTKKDGLAEVAISVNGGREEKTLVSTHWNGRKVPLILGRSFFREKALNWNTGAATLSITTSTPELTDGYAVDIEKGRFLFDGTRVCLPVFSDSTWVPSSAPYNGAQNLFKLDSKYRILNEGRIYLLDLRKQYQSAILSDAFNDVPVSENWVNETFYPGLTFFGSQSVVIDFRSLKIDFKVDSRLNGIALLGQRMLCTLEERNGRLYVTNALSTGMQKWLSDYEILGKQFVSKIGSVSVDPSKLGDKNYLLSLFRLLEANSAITFSDGESETVLGGGESFDRANSSR